MFATKKKKLTLNEEASKQLCIKNEIYCQQQFNNLKFILITNFMIDGFWPYTL